MQENEVTVVSDYEPSPKGEVVHRSRAKYKILVGGLGSGKSRIAIEEAKALLMEHDGLEMFIMRKTMPSNRDSTMGEFLKYMPEELGRHHKKHENFECVNDSKAMFRGLDEASKLKSTNPAVILLDEADEFTLEDFKTLKGRARQMRRPNDPRPPFPIHIILILNPVDDDHWIYKEFVENAAEYEADGGLLVQHFSTHDNIKHLPPGYIAQVTVGLTPGEIERYIEGKWGTIVKGKPIYGDIFNGLIHLEKWAFDEGKLPPYLRLQRGWDFGFNRPACSFRLKDPLNRKNIDFAMLGEKEHLDVFAAKVIAATETRYGKNIKFTDFCDPRGFDKSDKGQSSVDILNGLGIFPTGERGIRAYVDPGIKAVRKELSTLIGGKPELTINPEATIIRAAYAGRYVRGDDGAPKKDGYYEHIADADRYIAYMDKSSGAVEDAMEKRRARAAAMPRNARTGY